jgi:hypothetical protein
MTIIISIVINVIIFVSIIIIIIISIITIVIYVIIFVSVYHHPHRHNLCNIIFIIIPPPTLDFLQHFHHHNSVGVMMGDLWRSALAVV